MRYGFRHILMQTKTSEDEDEQKMADFLVNQQKPFIQLLQSIIKLESKKINYNGSATYKI